jgi:hypothetical protein
MELALVIAVELLNVTLPTYVTGARKVCIPDHVTLSVFTIPPPDEVVHVGTVPSPPEVRNWPFVPACPLSRIELDILTAPSKAEVDL